MGIEAAQQNKIEWNTTRMENIVREIKRERERQRKRITMVMVKWQMTRNLNENSYALIFL